MSWNISIVDIDILDIHFVWFIELVITKLVTIALATRRSALAMFGSFLFLDACD